MSGSSNIRYIAARRGVAVVLAGTAIGVAGWLLKWMVGTVSRVVTSGFDAYGENWWLIIVPVVGIVCVGLFVRHIVRIPLEHGTERLKADISSHRGRMPLRLTVSSMIASALTLGAGGSAGSEGPIAYTGAAIGSNTARFMGLGRKEMLIFLACGAGAGIAAIFKAPVGGIFFTIEVLGMTLGVTSLLMLSVMCLVSGLVAYMLSGCTTDMAVAHHAFTFDVGMFMCLLAIGVSCGIYAVYYRSVGNMVYRRIREVVPAVWRNILSGLLLGVSLLIFPALYGEGYGVLTHLADGDMSSATSGSLIMSVVHSGVVVWVLGGILLLKPVACYLTNSGGGVAGDFAPALFAGGIAGAFIYVISPQMGFFADVPVDVMVVCGMAAVMGAVVRAPVMTVFIVVEMTQQSEMLLPVSVAVAVAAGVSRLCERIHCC